MASDIVLVYEFVLVSDTYLLLDNFMLWYLKGLDIPSEIE
jgi:hypothetical protein